jgi:chromosome segregation ATPase
VTAPDNKNAAWNTAYAKLEAERDGLRAALAAARGTILDLRSHLADLRAAQEFLRLSREAAAAQARELQDQLAEAQAERRAHEHSLLAERTWLRDVNDAQASRIRDLEPIVQRAAKLTEERDALVHRAQSLDRLLRELRWESGPRSVQAVLPLARLMRRLAGG